MGSTSSTDVVLRTILDGVAVLTLNRPDRLNGWTADLEKLYFGYLEEAATDPAVRAIVVTGAGKGFCAGLDMGALEDVSKGATFEHSGKPQTFPLTIPKPIIAAVNGACAGLGLVQALMCDLRFAAAGAKLTTAFARRGLVAEHGISWLLPRLVGHANALDLLLSGRVILAEEALAIGLVNRVVAPESLLETAVGYARELAIHSSPASMAVMKRQVYRHQELDLAAAMRDTNELMAESLTRPDFREGVASFVEKRPPRFAPLGK